ncbi:hypothetical protein IKG12_00330 [Candidatus Saccharibacteria bacterium]|nr:hypothetical protein [Candidatus Saccharibacteria bacterium]
MHYILNPTDPDAGTNRINAVSRDNLMEGAGLKYGGYYGSTTLNNVGTRGYWWVSTIRGTNGAYSLLMYSDNTIYPQGNSDKYVGRSVR